MNIEQRFAPADTETPVDWESTVAAYVAAKNRGDPTIIPPSLLIEAVGQMMKIPLSQKETVRRFGETVSWVGVRSRLYNKLAPEVKVLLDRGLLFNDAVSVMSAPQSEQYKRALRLMNTQGKRMYNFGKL